MAKKFIETGLTKLVRTRPIIIITTLHENGVVNAGTFGAYTNVGPSQIGIAIGKSSDTYQNIKRTGELVINVLIKSIAAASEVCAQNIPRTESELDRAGLTTEPARKISVPLIKESLSNIECKFSREMEIGCHSFVVVECVGGHIEESMIDKDGGLDVVKAQVIYGIRYPDPVYATLSKTFEVEK